MLIYCGDCENGNIRVLDTEDGVTEEVDKIQLKVLQAKGYPIKKDFGYDYACECMSFLKNKLYSKYVPSYNEMSKDDAEDVLKLVTSYKVKFNVGISSIDVLGYKYKFLYISNKAGVIGIFANKDKILSLRINKYGVFTSSIDVTFPNKELIADFQRLESYAIMVMVRFKNSTGARFFYIDKYGKMSEEY